MATSYASASTLNEVPMSASGELKVIAVRLYPEYGLPGFIKFPSDDADADPGINLCNWPAPSIRYNLQLVMSVDFSSCFPFRQPAANSDGVW